MAQVPEPLVRTFNGRVLVIGFGSIGSGIVPLLLRHITVASKVRGGFVRTCFELTTVARPARGVDMLPTYVSVPACAYAATRR